LAVAKESEYIPFIEYNRKVSVNSGKKSLKLTITNFFGDILEKA